MENINLEKYKYISFDIFDTLIKRNVNKPVDVFKIIENEYKKKYDIELNQFVQNRIIAEKKCRKKDINSEITLSMIYNELENIYDKEICNKLMKLEEQIEVDITQRNNNPFVLSIYEKALKLGKVIITTDMYLPKKIIEQILKKNNLKYNKLYLSCEINKKKSNSELFKYILDDLNIRCDELFHIGDNIVSDYNMPKSLGIEAIKIDRETENLHYNKKNISKLISSNLNYNILYHYINNNIKSNEYFYNFGYSSFGPLLLGFSKWLIKNLEQKNINNVFFLARDGKIMKRAFDIMNTNSNLKSTYFMASRRSVIVPSFHKYNSIDEILKNIQIPNNITITDLSKRLGLDDVDITEIVKKYNLKFEKKYKYDFLLESKKEFLGELYPLVIENSKREYEAIINYSKKKKFNGKVAVVDIGWYGNMQNAMKRLFNNEIIGYYLGLRQTKKDNIETYGYLFDKGKNEDIDKKEFCFNSLFEFIFSATHGSVKRFILDDQLYELYESENTNNYESTALKNIQDGAIEFIRNYCNSGLDKYIELDERISVFNIFNVLCYPNYIDSVKIGDIRFKDGEINYLAQSLGMKKYVLKPNKLYKDLKDSLWKVGFLKRTFKLNISYYKLYKLLKKISR